ncbi:AAA family ATPase [Phaeodactylibacter luteus]|uniref:AAA family ATPase n=2 Tax=Phaeodactylibacter luteus TaxID=1564516 RepID=A0A5C6S319_9BACT|nr:AAA family ATPase [Phaeodactylibacter luteus]
MTDGTTYDIIRNRLQEQADGLRSRLSQLNEARKAVFGAVDTALIANDRIHTSNYCLARDIVAVGNYCLFGYNVQVGLRAGIALQDVFSGFTFTDNQFRESGLQPLSDEQFTTDFHNLYRYYKEAYFARFALRGQYLYMVFHLKPGSTDFKAFKWLIANDSFRYIDNRSDHEVSFPEQYEFSWKMASRDDQRHGRHPHVSILDRVFVETTGGDLTIKVEDNTNDGRGIFQESVAYKDQTLDDAEFAYADLGHLIALRIKPYQEEARYFIYNEKMQRAERIDALSQSGILLPDNQGLIFANGYYLQTGAYKVFDHPPANLRFKKRISSPNGEDFLFVFYSPLSGSCLLLQYNIISQEVATPIPCSGFTLFPNGELAYFKAEEEPTKHHVVQIWQTPFTSGEAPPNPSSGSYLYKVGNKEIVQAMAACQEVLTLTAREDSYANLYEELVKRTTELLDSYYWIGEAEAFRLSEPLKAIQGTAHTAIDEFEKELQARRRTKVATETVQERANALFAAIRRSSYTHIDEFVESLSELRALRGEAIGLKALRYADVPLIEQLEKEVAEANARIAEQCVSFLLEPGALASYESRIAAQAAAIPDVSTAAQAGEVQEAIQEISHALELLIEMVGNLKIEDPTQSTRIIDAISALFARLNQQQAAVRKREQALQSTEAQAAFGAQLKLLGQSTANYLSLSDSPEKCDEYLSRIMVQLEEIESKFAELEGFIEELSAKREEIYSAFEARRSSLVEARNNRTAALARAAERMLDGIQKRAAAFQKASGIHSFFSADLMVEKVRDTVAQLQALGDANKAAAVQARLKTLREEALRTLRDKQDLFAEGGSLIQLGRHRFSVNAQPLELAIVQQDGGMYYHLTGTNFYEAVEDPQFLQTKDAWGQALISENEHVYRAEYLAYQLWQQHPGWPAEREALLPLVQQAASQRYQEGYTRGVHDEDAAYLLSALLRMSRDMGLLQYPPVVRACAKMWWTAFAGEEAQELYQQQLSSAGEILRCFPATHEFDYLQDSLEGELRQFNAQMGLFPELAAPQAAAYLFRERTAGSRFICSAEAASLYQQLVGYLSAQKALQRFQAAAENLSGRHREQYLLLRKWVQAFVATLNEPDAWAPYLDETAALFFANDFDQENVANTASVASLNELRGSHPLLENLPYRLDFHAFNSRLQQFCGETVPKFQAYAALKRELAAKVRAQLQLDTFRPKVMSSFVRNRLIDQVYLPLFGDNLAKQIGTAGEQSRTDRMGMLLLLSPPGYGKTTLMEYLANRLGLVFMKINGPAIGHEVTSLAPEDANSMAAAKELEKLNLAFEMGDNIMLYLDDIQHCHPEFLQKFISLCDAQRRIEGVHKGKAKTYDLRGKRVAVVMAGNPYTESGARFKVPDMLANRADIYNLGDIIGGAAAAFQLSYIENALTSNPALSVLAGRSMKDVYTLVDSLESPAESPPEWEGSYSAQELADFRKAMQLLLKARDTVLLVNQEYIRAAGMKDAYRTEPAFRLQGSYRNMNKLAEKIAPVMNEDELQALLLSHYEGEVQTLTADAEANYLKLKELMGLLSSKEQQRWEEIKAAFRKNQLFHGADGQDRMVQVLEQLNAFNEGLSGIADALKRR